MEISQTTLILLALAAIFFMFWWIIWTLFDPEIKNLRKINELWNRLNCLLYRKQELWKILEEFESIKTIEHDEKKDFYVQMIKSLLLSDKI